MSARCSVGGTLDVARLAAEDFALAGGSALSCVLCGFFAAAGASPGVLLSPVSMLVVGFGAARAFDGRARQPGVEGKRPRGFLREEDVPNTARVAVPAATVAALVALGYDRERRLAALMKAGLAHAKREGAAKREAVLRRISEVGAGAFADPALHRALIHCAGPSEGGQLTSGDFTRVLEVDHDAVRSGTDDVRVLRCPWAGHEDELGETQHLLAAVDSTGAAAILCFEDAATGVDVEDLQLLAPELAQPVLRGVARVRPGTPLPMAAPIEVRVDALGRVLHARQSGLAEHPLVVGPPTR